jgi:hypothetical protein
MSLWLWTLAVLAGAGLAAAIAGSAIALAGLLHLQRRVVALRESSFITTLESLQIQTGRLTRVSGESEDLMRRAEAAVESLRRTPETAGISDIRNSWLQCAAQIRTLVQELS